MSRDGVLCNAIRDVISGIRSLTTCFQACRSQTMIIVDDTDVDKIRKEASWRNVGYR